MTIALGKIGSLFFVLASNCCMWILNAVQVYLVTHKHVTTVFADSTCEERLCNFWIIVKSSLSLMTAISEAA